MAEEEDMKAKLLAELKAQLSGEIKEELKKEFSESMRPARKSRTEKEKKPELPDTEVKENSAVISQLGNLPIPKHLLKTIGWGKGDVIDLKIENGKLLGERVGHTNVIPKQKAKGAEGAGEGQAGTGEGKADSTATSGVMKYIEFEFSEKPVMGKLRQVLENASKLYESGNAADGLNVLNMIESIELKVEEPDRGKMRMTAVKFLVDMIAKHPEAMETQMPQAMEITTKIATRYLQERAYGFVAAVYKQIPEGEAGFEQVMEVLFGSLTKYHVSELYAIISLLETIIKLLQGTSSPHITKVVDYIKDKFSKIDDNDYKVRFIKMLTSLEAFDDARALGKEFKAQTTEDSGEHRAALDALRENRDAQNVFFEKHPELQPETAEDLDADIDEELQKKSKKKPKETGQAKEEGEAMEQHLEEKTGEENKHAPVQEEMEAEEKKPVAEPPEVEEIELVTEASRAEEKESIPEAPEVEEIELVTEASRAEEKESIPEAPEVEEIELVSEASRAEEKGSIPEAPEVEEIEFVTETSDAKEKELFAENPKKQQEPTDNEDISTDALDEPSIDNDDQEKELDDAPEGD